MRLFVFAHLIFVFNLSVVTAHPNLQNSLSVAFEQSRIQIEIDVSVKELSVAHGIDGLPVNGVGRLNTAAIKNAAEVHRDYLLKHLKLSAGDYTFEGKVVCVTSPPFFRDPSQTFYKYQIDYPFKEPMAKEVTLFHEMLKEWSYSAGTPWNVCYTVKIKRGSALETSSWLMPCQQAVTIPTGGGNHVASVIGDNASGDYRTFQEYLWHGFMHILTGYDHLLFIAALVLGATNFWEMVKVIGAFTVAHSITITLCVFGLLRLPSYIVEPLIAMSIVCVAVNNVTRPQGFLMRFRIVAAFGFGLVHGLGFAGGLLDVMTGLPPRSIWIALVAFSLGVELGHQLVVLPLFGILSLTRQKIAIKRYIQLFRYLSLLIALGGSYFLIVALK